MALLERTGVLAELRALTRRAASGTGGMLLLAGEPGVGKTALVREIGAEVPASMRRWSGGCDPLPTPPALGPLLDIAQDDPRVQALVDEMPTELAPRLLRLLRNPTLVVVEDIHWMDEATCELLVHLARRVQRTRAAVVATYRHGTQDGSATMRRFLAAVGSAPGVHLRELAPLSRAAVAELARGSAVDADELYRRTGGNPFYVTEVLAEPGRSVPGSVAAAVLARADRLSEAGREFLDLVSLAPEGLAMDVAEEVLGTDRARAGLDEVTAASMLSPRGGRLEFRHELARSAVAQAVPPGRQVTMHGRLLIVLEARPGTHPARLAHHASAMGDVDALRRHAPAAAELAYRRGAYRAAEAHVESVLAHDAVLGAEERAGLLGLLADSRWQLESPELLIEDRKRAAEAWARAGQPGKQARQLVLAAGVYHRCGNRHAATETFAEARSVVQGQMLDPDVGCVMVAELAMVGARFPLPTTLELAEKAVLELAAIDAHEPLVTALTILSSTRLMLADRDAAVADGCRAVELARAHAPQLVVQQGLHIAAAFLACRHTVDATAFLQAICTEVERREEVVLGARLDALVAQACLQRGDFTGAVAKPGLDRLPYPVPMIEAQRALTRGLHHARTGDPTAGDLLDEAAEMGEWLGGLGRTWPAAAARAELAWLVGEDHLIGGLTQKPLARATTVQHPWATGELRYWRRQAGIDDGPPPTWVAEPWRLMLTDEPEAAAEAWRTLAAPYERALALAGGGVAEQREALAIVDAIGATPLADRVRAMLRTAGADHVPARPRTHGDLLTARQWEVLALMADGHTNGQIAHRLSISEKTAGHHVSAVLGRLGVGSRAEAVAEALRTGLLDHAPGHGHRDRR